MTSLTGTHYWDQAIPVRDRSPSYRQCLGKNPLAKLQGKIARRQKIDAHAQQFLERDQQTAQVKQRGVTEWPTQLANGAGFPASTMKSAPAGAPFAIRRAIYAVSFNASATVPNRWSICCSSTISGGENARMSPVQRTSTPFSKHLTKTS